MGGSIIKVIDDLLMDLTRADIQLEAHNGKIRYHPRSAMTQDLLGRVKTHKQVLMDSLESIHNKSQTRAEKEVQRFLRECVPYPDSRGAYDPKYENVIKALANVPLPQHQSKRNDVNPSTKPNDLAE